MEQEKRVGFFTSSQISRLCGSLKNGEPTKAFYTYIEDVKLEIALGRSLDVEVNTKPLKWGQLFEIILFQKKELGLNYKMAHKLTIIHDKIKHFSGTPDLIEPGVRVAENKCFYPKNFAKLSLCLLKKDVELLKEEFPSIYWQVLSNAILCEVDRAEIIVFMPYKDELIDIIEQVEQTNILEGNNLNPADYWFLQNDDIETLPYLPNDSKMKNINRFEFEVPTKDKTFLISRIKEAVELLVEL